MLNFRVSLVVLLGVALVGLTSLYFVRDTFTVESWSAPLSELISPSIPSGHAGTESPVEDLSKVERLIIVAHYHEQLDWIDNASAPVRVIDKEDPTNVDNLNSNRHTESSSYLYFMIKYYDYLPKKIAFVHGHGHHAIMSDEIRGPLRDYAGYDPSSDQAIDAWVMRGYSPLNMDSADVTVNTRYEDDGGTLFWFGPPASYPTREKGVDRPDKADFDAGYLELWAFLEKPIAQGGLGITLPRFVTFKCCSSFVVDKEDIQRIPKEILIRLFEFLENESRKSAGNAMEHVWTLLFNTVHWNM